MDSITCYKTKDGTVFEDMEAAILHECELEFEEWYETNELYGDQEGCKIIW